MNAPAGTDTGAMPVSVGNGFCNVTALLLDAEESAALTAAMVTELEAGMLLGATYTPEALMVPVAPAPPATPFTCQVTEVFDVPATVALKDCVAPARTLALAGDTVTVTLDPAEDVPEGGPMTVPVQPARAATASRITKSNECRKAKVLKFSINGGRKKRRSYAETPPLNYDLAGALKLLYERTISDREQWNRLKAV